MTLKKFEFICWSILGIVAYCFSMLFWNGLLGSLTDELIFALPFAISIITLFFLFMFLFREMGCLFFMPKTRLMAVLNAGDPNASLGQRIKNAFSWAFVKRILMYAVLFSAEFYLRIISIVLYLSFLDRLTGVWEKIGIHSQQAVLVLWIALGYLIMELPWYLLFYKVSFKGRSNRSSEYRFGMKVFLFVIGIFLIRYICEIIIPGSDSVLSAVFSFIVLVALSLGLWWLMYRKKWTCCECPVCSKIKMVSGGYCACWCKKNDVKTDSLPPEDKK